MCVRARVAGQDMFSCGTALPTLPYLSDLPAYCNVTGYNDALPVGLMANPVIDRSPGSYLLTLETSASL